MCPKSLVTTPRATKAAQKGGVVDQTQKLEPQEGLWSQQAQLPEHPALFLFPFKDDLMLLEQRERLCVYVGEGGDGVFGLSGKNKAGSILLFTFPATRA